LDNNNIQLLVNKAGGQLEYFYPVLEKLQKKEHIQQEQELNDSRSQDSG